MIYIIHDAEVGSISRVIAISYPNAVTKYLKWRGEDLPDPITTKAEADAICGDEGLTVVEEGDIGTV